MTGRLVTTLAKATNRNVSSRSAATYPVTPYRPRRQTLPIHTKNDVNEAHPFPDLIAAARVAVEGIPENEYAWAPRAHAAARDATMAAGASSEEADRIASDCVREAMEAALSDKGIPPYLVVETSPGKLSILSSAPGDPERTAKSFGYVVLAHCVTMEEAEKFLGEERGRLKTSM